MTAKNIYERFIVLIFNNANIKNMKNSKLTFSDFQIDKLSKEEQKIIRGGNIDPNDQNYPKKTGGNGNP